MFLPGTHIPIGSPEQLNDSTTPLICLLAVNQENEDKVSRRLRENLKRPLWIVSISRLPISGLNLIVSKARWVPGMADAKLFSIL